MSILWIALIQHSAKLFVAQSFLSSLSKYFSTYTHSFSAVQQLHHAFSASWSNARFLWMWGTHVSGSGDNEAKELSAGDVRCAKSMSISPSCSVTIDRSTSVAVVHLARSAVVGYFSEFYLSPTKKFATLVFIMSIYGVNKSEKSLKSSLNFFCFCRPEFFTRSSLHTNEWCCLSLNLFICGEPFPTANHKVFKKC